MSRDSNGNYTLPAGNPVVPGTTIESDWANMTMDDIAVALSDSLSRSGQGGMLVPFANADGTQANPGITWQNAPTWGFFRDSNGMHAVVNGQIWMSWTPTGAQIGGLPLATSPVTFPDGTVTEPGIRFTADTNTGFVRDSGGLYAVWDGAAVMNWNAGGAYVGGSPVVTEALLIGQPRTFTAPQRVQVLSTSSLSLDMNAATDFAISGHSAGELGFSNVAAGQRGMILISSGGQAITLAAGILAPQDMEADISSAGNWYISYWAVTPSTIVMSYSGPMV